jgi:hypothetical protein
MVSSRLKKGETEESTEDELRLVDAVLAAFCFQSEREKRYARRLRVQALYRAFAELREKYPTWLQDMSFTHGPADTVPVSGVLEDILFDLGASGIMAVENPWYRYLKIPASKLDLFRKAISKRRNKSEQSQLRSLADEFDQLYSKALRKG